MNLNNYELDDFLSDESFQNWALKRGPLEHHQFWQQWTADHPEKKPLWEEAAHMLSIFRNSDEKLDPEIIKSSWENFSARIQSTSSTPAKTLNGARFNINRFYKYAAVIAFAVIALTVLYVTFNAENQPSYITYQSGFGERKEIVLPDGSIVTLNANSELKTITNWTKRDREIWLNKGEAFFSVTKKANRTPFVVHTDHLDVTVLGTEFNINLKKGTTQVMLKEGKVKLSLRTGEESLMNPGELAEYAPGSPLSLKKVESLNYYNWLNGKIVFNNTPLHDIALFIEDHYGVSVGIENSTLSKRTLSGELPNDSLSLLLSALEVTMDLSIAQKENEILIRKK